jgi:hypothetical protein
MSITAVTIRNFRSILTFNDKMRDLNIFVGQNDEGKSNVLRALDLFFTHDRDDGYKFDWSHDYCCFATKRVRKAEEVTITLEITPPPSFANRNPVVWRKTWRRDGFYREFLQHQDGSDVSPRSKIDAFLRAMRFDYVPAIKGNDYFQRLMSKLHDMLEATVEEQIRAASGSFTNTINENTKPILAEILERLNLETTIQLPPNLRELFAQLEFTSISGAKPFSLSQRGDGIKVRHIPIVLRWLADQANHLSAPGRPKVVTVWGYEEPENNLELSRCFALAKDFVKGCSQIQTFVTTHSPAFYSVFRDSDPEKVGLFLVFKDKGQPTSTIRNLADRDLLTLDSSMGLLDLLKPHFKEAENELNKLRTAAKTLVDTNIPTIFCEGPTDKILFDEALRLFFPAKATQVSVRCSPHHGGGHNWVSDILTAWSFSRPLAKAVGVFDKDEDAQSTKKKTEQQIHNPPSGKKAFTLSLAPGNELKECYRRSISVPFALEELLPEDIWNLAEANGWLEDRSSPLFLYKFDRPDVTFNDHFRATLPEPHLLRLALKKVQLERKEGLANHIVGLPDENNRRRVLTCFQTTLEECLKKLDLLAP